MLFILSWWNKKNSKNEKLRLFVRYFLRGGHRYSVYFKVGLWEVYLGNLALVILFNINVLTIIFQIFIL